jgi:hypothetical protein
MTCEGGAIFISFGIVGGKGDRFELSGLPRRQAHSDCARRFQGAVDIVEPGLIVAIIGAPLSSSHAHQAGSLTG